MGVTMTVSNPVPAGTVKTPRPTRRPGLSAYRTLWVSLRSFAVFFLLWWLLHWWNGNPLQLPSPLKVFEALWGLYVDGGFLAVTR